jgi:hypothetical protein
MFQYQYFGYIAEGFTYAIAVYGLVRTIGAMIPGADQKEVDALATSLSAGIMSYQFLQQVFGKGGWVFGDDKVTGSLGKFAQSPITQGVVAAGVAWIVYNAMWEKEKTNVETVSFRCLPWQAPHGGEDCELCNDDTLPCSEYRCKSLGQSCGIINAGTTSEQCVNKNPRDVSPPVISPYEEALTDGYTYFDVKTMPPGAGFKIKSVSTATGCIPPFTPITFGIETNEPAQCKIDSEPRGNYSAMSVYFGGSNLYSYNHTEYLSLPSVEDMENSSLQLENGKEITFYMRCIDSMGNANEADYELKVCVDPTPDVTPPVILGTSITNAGCVASNSENASVQFYVNEPSACKWDYLDTSFGQMKYNMSCSTSVQQMNALMVYPCSAFFEGIKRTGTNFYVRCEDNQNSANASSRNPNRESYVYNLASSNPLKLKNLQPNETLYSVVSPVQITLSVETLFGCDNNKAVCYYSTDNNNFVQFFDTNKDDGISTQLLSLAGGSYTYYVKCVDSGGNLAQNSTTFKIDYNPNSPMVVRVFEDREKSYLTVVTPTESECAYTNTNCDFLFVEGTAMPYANTTQHMANWNEDETLYIKCRDAYRTEPVGCSIVVQPTKNFL